MFTHRQHILKTPIEYLKGVGPQKALVLQSELGVETFGDLLDIFPFRYVDRSQIAEVRSLRDDSPPVQLIGQITHVDITGYGRAKRLVAQFKDKTGRMELLWFQGIAMFERMLAQGGHYLVFGKPARYQGYWTMTHPELDKLEGTEAEHMPPYLPVYSSTEKLRARWLSGRHYVKLVQQLFLQLKEQDLEEILPVAWLKEYKFVSRYQAYRHVHFPENQQWLEAAIRRLKFEELFLQQLKICKLKQHHEKVQGVQFVKVGELFNTFYKEYLPFELTEDQKKVLKEIRLDTQTGHQMNRLLQGDVGSGKTMVALLCMLLALDNGYQACLMAPTEILAQQHYVSLSALLQEMPVRVGLLTGKMKARDRQFLLSRLASGQLAIVIGTHALLEEQVKFQQLGLCIIDEQHRFGVEQRARLWKKSILPPHILVMTATPIPRTLAMTLYGDLDVSVIQTLPPGRKPITTVHRSEMQRAKVMDFIRHEVDAGHQAYIVYPLIEESEKLDYENLLAGYEQVRQFFPAHRYQIAMVHGRQKADEREANMNSFVKGKAQILVATTVIEVGVNVPNASVMLIESAERFGLSQLHQLRGRVGRGAEQSYCILMTTSKISAVGRQRIQIMVDEQSGFAIAEKDMALRGPGEIDGTKQSGIAELKLASLVTDADLVELARKLALQLIQEDPGLQQTGHRALKELMLSRKDAEVWSRIS